MCPTLTLYSGVNILGIVENMSDIRIPLNSLATPKSGVRLVDSEGKNVTKEFLIKLQEQCPEMLDVFIESDLFRLPSSGGEDTPEGMARRFQVPYLGKLAVCACVCAVVAVCWIVATCVTVCGTNDLRLHVYASHCRRKRSVLPLLAPLSLCH